MGNTIWYQEDFEKGLMVTALKGSSSYEILELNEEEQLIKVIPLYSVGVEPEWLNIANCSITPF